MKIVYDAEIDALSIAFQDTTVTSRHLEEGITADYDADGNLAGIEILDAGKRLGNKDTFRQIVIGGNWHANSGMTPDGEGRLVFGRFDWPTDLTVGRLYQVLSDEHGRYRVVDDMGEDYMYPIWMFEHAFQQSLP